MILTSEGVNKKIESLSWEKFSWEKFQKEFKISSDVKPANVSFITQQWGCSPAFRFLILAYFDSCSLEQSNYQNVCSLADKLGFNYQFSSCRELLERQLQKFGINLLKKNNDYQYLRTLQIYSGKIYVKFARDIGKEIRDSSWEQLLDQEFIENLIGGSFEQYRTLNDSELDNGLNISDISLFFYNLAIAYQRTHLINTADILRFAPLTDAVARNILKEMLPNDKTIKSIDDLETHPQIGIRLNDNGEPEAVFEFPNRGHFPPRTEFVAFYIGDGTENRVRYSRDNEWRKDAENKVYPINQFHKINKIIKIADKKIKSEVTPLCCHEEYIIIQAKEDGNGNFTPERILSPGDKLNFKVNKKFFIFSTQSESIDYRYDSSEENYSLKSLNPPLDASELIVGEDHYILEKEYKWLNTENAVKWLDSRKHSSRLFFSNEDCCNESVLGDSCFDEPNIIASYQWDDSERITIFSNKEWQIPSVCFWKRGKIRFEQNGIKKFERAVTFLGGIDWSNLSEPIPSDERRKVSVKFEGKPIECEILPLAMWWEGEYNGFYFRKRVNRPGVNLVLESEKRVIPLRKDTFGLENIFELAKDDFDRMKGEICALDDSSVIVTRGNYFAKISSWKFKLHNLLDISELKNTTSNYYSICINRDYYKFHIYDPQEERVKVEWSGHNLNVEFMVAYCRIEVAQYLYYMPIHRQDDGFKNIKANKFEISIDEFGRCRCKLTFGDFGADTTDWGAGLLCFIAGEKKLITPLFSGGFVVRNENWSEDYQYEDDPYGLRQALTTKSMDNLTSIMGNEDPQCRDWVSSFITKMTANICNTLDAQVCNYLNCYRNKLRNSTGKLIDKSGYIFIAGWFIVQKMETAEWLNYQEFWDELMLSYPYYNHIQYNPPLRTQVDCIEKMGIEYFFNSEEWAIEDALWLWNKTRYYSTNNDNSSGAKINVHHAFSWAQLSEIIRRKVDKFKVPFKARGLNKIICFWKNCSKNILEAPEQIRINQEIFHEVDSEIYHNAANIYIDNIQAFEENPYLFQAGYGQSDGASKIYDAAECLLLRKETLLNFLKDYGKQLHEYRQRPDFNENKYQYLRETLLRLRKIDTARLRWDTNVIKLREVVNMYAELAYEEDKNKGMENE